MDKATKYLKLLEDAKALIDPSVDDIANMANLVILIQEHFNHHWVGFYRVRQDYLFLGPFSGPIACTKIAYNKGVCGNAWAKKTSLTVDNVHEYAGHIACSPLSNSEIVIPCIRNGEVYAVLDIDSTSYSAFNEDDRTYLEELVSLL